MFLHFYYKQVIAAAEWTYTIRVLIDVLSAAVGIIQAHCVKAFKCAINVEEGGGNKLNVQMIQQDVSISKVNTQQRQRLVLRF